MFSVRLSARIVDTPANEMHTDAFIEVGWCIMLLAFFRKGCGIGMQCMGALHKIYYVGFIDVSVPVLRVSAYFCSSGISIDCFLVSAV